MDKLDKMLMQAKATHRKMSINPVHIIEDGYCYACEGICMYIDNEKMQIDDNVVVIINDIPDWREKDGAEKEDQIETG